MGKAVTRLAPTVTIVSYGKMKCNLGVSLGAFATLRGGRRTGLFICRTVERSTRVLCKFCSGRRETLFLLLVAISKVKKGATHVVLSTLAPSRLINIVDSNGSGLLGAIGKVNLGATRHVVISLGSGVASIRVRNTNICASKAVAGARRSRVLRRTISTLAVLKFPPTPSRGIMRTVLGRRPRSAIRHIVGLTLGELWGWSVCHTSGKAM